MLSQRRAKMIKPWRRTRSQQNESYRVFSIRTDTAISPRTDESHDFYVIESRDWINIIPITPDERVVMVKQYRHGSREITLEIPGGIVDPGDDFPGSCCPRVTRGNRLPGGKLRSDRRGQSQSSHLQQPVLYFFSTESQEGCRSNT